MLPLRDNVNVRVLHEAARIAVRALPPLRAKQVIDAIGRLMRPLSADEARTAVRGLGGAGSCLTRALAISAVLPASEVVIGVDPRRSETLYAHAWVEVNGTPLDGTESPVVTPVERLASLGTGPASKRER